MEKNSKKPRKSQQIQQIKYKSQIPYAFQRSNLPLGVDSVYEIGMFSSNGFYY